ncbi:hypothetical protein swp_1763 [Shewanella piezotolerans WP3]|uniref:Uncharacterized protein n=1 Tax=Shewanella piezotolerans (strain WP3 / JCM 13877) TaxID=225849 RepID=B8CN29_SHEPW|nr:hypothetical protein swp_1763 [Shewanella piezotolerans WP3]
MSRKTGIIGLLMHLLVVFDLPSTLGKVWQLDS